MAYATLGGGRSSSTPQDIPSSKKTVQRTQQKPVFSVQTIAKKIRDFYNKTLPNIAKEVVSGIAEGTQTGSRLRFASTPQQVKQAVSAPKKPAPIDMPQVRRVAEFATEQILDPLSYAPIPVAFGGKLVKPAASAAKPIANQATKALVTVGTRALEKPATREIATQVAKELVPVGERALTSVGERLLTSAGERALEKPALSAIERRLASKPIANQAAKEAVETPGKQLIKESVEEATKLSKPAESVFKEGAEQAAKQTTKEAVKEGLETAIGQTAEQAAKAATTSGLKSIANLAKKVLPYAAVGGAAALLATPSGEQQQPTMNQPETQQTPTGQQSTNNGWVDLKDVQSKLEQQYPTYPTSQGGIPTQTKTSQPGITSQTTGQSQQPIRQEQQPSDTITAIENQNNSQPIIDTTTLMDNVNNSIEDLITIGTIELSKPDTSPDVLAVYNQYLSDILSSIEKRINDLKSTAEQQGKELDQSTLLSLDTLRQRLSDELKSVREELNRRGLYESGILLELETKLRNNELSKEARILSERLNKIYDNLNNSLNQLYNAAIDVQSKYGLAAADAYAKAKANYEQQRQDLLTKLINARLEQRSQLSKEQQAALDRQFKEQQAELDRQLKELQLQQENYWKQQNYNLQQQKAQTPKYSASATQAAISRIPNFSSREEALAVLQQELPILQAQGVDVNAVIQAINAYFGTNRASSPTGRYGGPQDIP